MDELLARTGGFGWFQTHVGLALFALQASCAAVVMLPTYVSLSAQREWGTSSTTPMVQAFFAGQLVGFPLWGLAADRLGRKPTTNASLLLLATFSLLSFAATSPTSYAWLRLPVGLASGGAWIGQQTLGVEYCAPPYRILFYVISGLGWTAGEVYAVLLAWALSSAGWRTLLLLHLPVLPTLLLLHFLPETPRYLLQRGDAAGAMETIRRIARANGRPLDGKAALAAGVAADGGEGAEGWTRMLAQLLSPSVAPRLALVSAIWFGAAGSYYGVAFLKQDLSVFNPYVTTLLENAVELLSLLVLALIAEHRGRRACLALFFVLCAVGFIVLQVAQPQSTLELVFILIERTAASLVASLIWLVVAEVFPTSIRSVTLGLAAACGRAGCIVCPALTDGSFGGGFAVMAAITLCSAIGTLFLQEMTGAALSDTVSSL
ncbi:hypothetical protein AB1Y20_016406 [Prymnesium parvum]|uniref:Major facilitator superfamily (MFS) profile domain-containing protein n=1 Tax=Prymnesium parvum TaxID=97485 RepID=A0AB34IF66_PRYPA